MTAPPCIRASHCKGTLRALQRVVPGSGARILAALPPAVRDGLAGATDILTGETFSDANVPFSPYQFRWLCPAGT